MFNKKIFTLLILIIILQTFGILYIKREAIKSYYHSTFNKDNLKNIWSEILASFKTEEIQALTSIEKEPIKKFELTVSPSEWREINSGITKKSTRDQIDAKLVVDDESFECTVRISKGAPRHWQGDRKSIRLRFPEEHLFHGIHEINLNIPETEKVIIDPVAWDFANKMGLVTPEFNLIKLEINGQNEGVRLLYEDADRYFLERNSLMGYIFTEKNQGVFPFDYRSSNDVDYPSVSVINKKGNTLNELIWLNKVLSYPSLDQFKKQITKLMDINQVLTWHSNALLCGSGHQNIHNIKLFYNSSLQKFQFIPWDIAGFEHWTHPPRKMWAMDLDWSTNRFIFRINQIPEFVEQRNRILWRFLNGKLNLENQLTVIDKYYKLIRYHIYVDELKQASGEKFSNQDFENSILELKNWVKLRRDFIISELEKADLRVSVNPLKTNQNSQILDNQSSKQGLVLSLGTGKQSGVYLKSIKVNSTINNLNKNNISLYKDTNGNEMLDKGDLEVKLSDIKINTQSSRSTVELILDELLLPARMVNKDPYFDYWDKGYTLQVKPSFKYYNYILVYASSGSKSVFTNDVEIKSVNSVTGSSIQAEYFTYDPEKEFALIYREGSSPKPAGLLNDLSGEINKNQSSEKVNLVSYLQELKDRNNIIIPSANYILDKTWKVEEDEVITVAAGTKINIDPGASIYVRGVLNFEGNANSPIILDSGLQGQPWGCLIYHKTEKNSRLSYVTIRYAGMAKIDNVNFTGGVSAYDATILMESCIFDQIRADDGINVKNSKTRLLGCQFIQTKDDALDYDFSSGEIRNCYFYKSGGDAIDCGTANPRVIGNLVELPADKCISVGEASSPVIENNFLIGGTYGIAIKDDSNPFISNNTIVGNKIGISFYIKKPHEFGAPTASIEKCILWDNEIEIENISDSKFTIKKSAIQGGFVGDNISIEPPEFKSDAVEIKSKYVLKENSYYSIKGYGAKSGIWQ